MIAASTNQLVGKYSSSIYTLQQLNIPSTLFPPANQTISGQFYAIGTINYMCQISHSANFIQTTLQALLYTNTLKNADWGSNDANIADLGLTSVKDGTTTTVAPIVSISAPDNKGMPWVLYQSTYTNRTGTNSGVFNDVNYVLMFTTKNGFVPDQSNCTLNGTTFPVSYNAEYYVFKDTAVMNNLPSVTNSAIRFKLGLALFALLLLQGSDDVILTFFHFV
ncbi:hypothetical protein HDV01_000721 [Terramyces sp. JEL0728]|nr:hypothetical protein HDV01_000721 [Terramyces sp. JEL0728]